MSFHQMIWLKSSSFPPPPPVSVQLFTSALKPHRVRRFLASSKPVASLLLMLHWIIWRVYTCPGEHVEEEKGWHRQALWLMQCLVCPWADSGAGSVMGAPSPFRCCFFSLIVQSFCFSVSRVATARHSHCSTMTFRTSNVGSEVGVQLERVTCHFQTLKSHF